MEENDARSSRGEEEGMVVRIGVLGASWIAPPALYSKLKLVPHARVVCVAARDIKRAEECAKKHNIPKVHATYEEVITDPEVDLVYNPLPNSLHKKWTIAALEAGKHVLCEKPMATTEEEVQEMFAAAKKHDRLLVEAFHWRFHPLANRLREIIDSGEIGKVKHAQAKFRIPIFKGSDIRYNRELGGGSVMDTGCYVINFLRMVVGDNPTPETVDGDADIFDAQVVRAIPTIVYPQVDSDMNGQIKFVRCAPTNAGASSGESEENVDISEQETITATFDCSIFSFPACSAVIQGELGEMLITNWVAPSFYHNVTVRKYEAPPPEREGMKWWMLPTKDKSPVRSEKVSASFDTQMQTYTYQLMAVVKAVQAGLTANSSVADTLKILPMFPYYDAVHNMRVIDRIYDKADMERRFYPPRL